MYAHMQTSIKSITAEIHPACSEMSKDTGVLKYLYEIKIDVRMIKTPDTLITSAEVLVLRERDKSNAIISGYKINIPSDESGYI